MLGNFTSKENLLLFFTKGQRTHLGHAIFANHCSSKFSSSLDVICGACSNAPQECFLSNTSPHQYRDLTEQIFFGVVMTIAFGQLLCHTQSHAPRNDRDLV